MNGNRTHLILILALVTSVVLNILAPSVSEARWKADPKKTYNCLVYATLADDLDRTRIGREKMTADQCVALAESLITLRCMRSPGESFKMTYVIDDPESTDDFISPTITGACQSTSPLSN